MRVVIFRFLLLALSAVIIVMPGAALFDVGFAGGPVNIGIPYVAGPGFTFAAPFSQGGLFMQAANTSTLAHDYTGSLAIAFQPQGSGSAGSPLIVSPTIAQATSESIAATQSYFFNDIVVAA